MNTFHKDERLCSRKLIDTLFFEGKTFFVHPFKITWLDTSFENKFPAQILLHVGKHHFKHAVDRNKIKRQMREAYRKNKSSFYDYLIQHQKQCAFQIAFVSKEKITFKELELKIILILQRLQEQYEKYSD